MNTVKEVLESLTFFDEEQENMDPQKYFCKEELDLKWDEENSKYDDNCATFVGKSIEKSNTIKFESDESILSERKSHLKEMNINIEKTDTGGDGTNKNKNFQNYYCKEELDIDWDKNDNNYEQNHASQNQELIEKSKAYEGEKNKSAPILPRKKHMKIENPDTAKDCPKCKKRLKNLNTLKKHLFYCGKAPHLQCDSCSYKAKYKNALIVHIKRCHPQQIQLDLRKRKTTKKVKSKTNKIVNEEQQSDKYSRYCVNCKVKTDNSESNNCNKCESCLLYQCKKCNATLSTRVAFIRHVNTICEPRGYYHCPACDYKSTFKGHVKNHLKGHLLPGSHLDTEVIKWKNAKGKNDSEQMFTCPSCDKQFQRKASLSSHARLCVKSQGVSKPSPRYVENENRKKGRSCELSRLCTKCNDEVLSNKTRTSKCCGSSILFKCLKCNKAGEDHASMKYHVKNICFKTKCDLCDFEGSKIRVAAHYRHKHDFNSVECPKCKTVVKNRSLLYTHTYLICGKEPLKCDYCPFKSKKNTY